MKKTGIIFLFLIFGFMFIKHEAKATCYMCDPCYIATVGGLVTDPIKLESLAPKLLPEQTRSGEQSIQRDLAKKRKESSDKTSSVDKKVTDESVDDLVDEVKPIDRSGK